MEVVKLTGVGDQVMCRGLDTLILSTWPCTLLYWRGSRIIILTNLDSVEMAPLRGILPSLAIKVNFSTVPLPCHSLPLLIYFIFFKTHIYFKCYLFVHLFVKSLLPCQLITSSAKAATTSVLDTNVFPIPKTVPGTEEEFNIYSWTNEWKERLIHVPKPQCGGTNGCSTKEQLQGGEEGGTARWLSLKGRAVFKDGKA